ncbi:MAG: hypothetical protein AAGH83_07020 [Pseudomonadota bacterium]
MTDNAYTRSVQTFEALLAAPASVGHATPAALIKSAALPASSGYRHVATLEAEGFLRRDVNGAYLIGPAAIRTGMRAHCAGRFAPAVQPILLQLRQATQATAFLAFSQDMTLKIGPHSIGRDARRVPLQEVYDFESVPEFALETVSEVALRAFQDGIPRRTRALLTPVEVTSDTILHLGLLPGIHRGDPDALSFPLKRAGAQFREAALEQQ